MHERRRISQIAGLVMAPARVKHVLLRLSFAAVGRFPEAWWASTILDGRVAAWRTSPAATELEGVVVEWLREMFGVSPRVMRSRAVSWKRSVLITTQEGEEHRERCTRISRKSRATSAADIVLCADSSMFFIIRRGAVTGRQRVDTSDRTDHPKRLHASRTATLVPRPKCAL